MVESSSTGVAAQLTIPARVKTIKAHLNKARQYEDKSGQHYISAGLHLAELKDWHKRELKRPAEGSPGQNLSVSSSISDNRAPIN